VGLLYTTWRQKTKLHTFREALVNDEQRPETSPVPNVEADVLFALTPYNAGLEEDCEIEETEGETETEDEMSDEDMGDEEEVSDKETKVGVEHKASDKEEGEAQKVGEKETAVPDQEPKDGMVCLKAVAVERLY
jgi:hypothetical protein